MKYFFSLIVLLTTLGASFGQQSKDIKQIQKEIKIFRIALGGDLTCTSG